MDIGIHGFNVHDPEQSIGKLEPYIKDLFMFNYGWRFFSVLWHNKKDAKKLKALLGANEDSVVYAHSNGCAIAVEAARQGAKIKTLICINPALKMNTKFPDTIERISVIHTKHNKATKAARFLDKATFIQLAIPNAWGAMGAKGSTLPDERVRNWDLSNRMKGHSDFFKQENLELYVSELKTWIDSGVVYPV